MDYEQDENFGGSEQPIPVPQPVIESLPKVAKKRRGWGIFWGVCLSLSVLGNIVLIMMVIGVVTVFATGQREVFAEYVVQSGPRTAKIVIIDVHGVINGEKSKDVFRMLKNVRKDPHVKGLIVRVNSPGGMVSSSDQIYNEIRKYRTETKKPAIAFMSGVAASGGYYASVACEKIIAEPTVITGSVGVIMGYFVLQKLLEEKLGIQPVVVKSGLKKDWPSSFRPPTEEQRKYIHDKLITPAYERFVRIVDEGRPSLTLADVKRLADGSIYGADEALAEGMIDKIGYLDEAIELIKSLAGIEKAQVVEYRKPFSLAQALRSSSAVSFLKMDRASLYELNTPQLLYLWRQ